MQELQKAGYATDPDYANKVLNIYQRIKAVN
jgi:flagellum-specific peptidoglycan hydrolase FlgJ